MSNVLPTANPIEHQFAQFVRILGKGKTGSRSLSFDEARTAMTLILQGQALDVQIGAFLMLLRVKEESPEELAGFVMAVRDYIKAPTIPADLDWSSYAGKKKHQPWFLLTIFCLSSRGIRVFCHGTHGHTAGRVYTEQVIEQLGLPIAQNWNDVNLQLDSGQFSFMPLSALCPPLQSLIELRNLLGLRSPVHTLSRLINPLDCAYSAQSIFHPAYAISHQRAAAILNQANMVVVKGEGGEIERKPDASCTAHGLRDGTAYEETWPRLLDGRQQAPDHISADKLKQLWCGTLGDEYGERAVVGTLAIVLKLLNYADSQADAFALAESYWHERDKDWLDRIAAG